MLYIQNKTVKQHDKSHLNISTQFRDIDRFAARDGVCHVAARVQH